MPSRSMKSASTDQYLSKERAKTEAISLTRKVSKVKYWMSSSIIKKKQSRHSSTSLSLAKQMAAMETRSSQQLVKERISRR